MRKLRWIGVSLVMVLLVAAGVALGVTLGRVDESAASTLTLRSSVAVPSGDSIVVWQDQGRSAQVTTLKFLGGVPQPPLRPKPFVGPVTVFIENFSTSDLVVRQPCGPVKETSSHTRIGAIDAVVYALDGTKLGSTCDRPPMARLASGDMVRAEVRLDLDLGVGSGDYSFETLFRAVDLRIQPPSGMVSWWPGDGNARDIQDGNDGTLTGDYATAVVGKGFKLDGTGDFVLVLDSSNLNITGDVTVDLWAKRTVLGPAIMVGKDGGVNGSGDLASVYILNFATGDQGGDQLMAGFELADGSNVLLSGPIVTDTNFHHYAYVRSSDTHRLLMDGELVASGTFVGVPGDTSGLPLVIGAGRTPTGFVWHFGGIIDEVEIFNRALSDAEINAIFKVGAAGKTRVLADSAAEFSGTQGQNNWSYGYYDGPFDSSDFQLMTQFTGDLWYVQEGTYWTNLWEKGGHPNGPVSSGGRQDVEHWPVRRWISEVGRNINMSGTIAKNNTGGGDGITGHILVDGVKVFSQALGASDSTGVNYSISATVKVGSVVDFAIEPGGTDHFDGTDFTAIITR